MTHILGAGREITKDYNTIYLHEEDDTRAAKMEMWIAKDLGEALMKNYPQRQWEVRVDIMGDMIIILVPSLDKEHGYHLRIRQDTISALRRRAIMAGGEILERYGLSRGRHFNPDNIEQFDRNARDDVIPTSNSMLGENPLKD